MNLFGLELFKKSDVVQDKITNEQILNFIKHGSFEHVSATEAYTMYENIGPLADAIDMIATKFADLKPVILDKNGKVAHVPDVEKFFVRPNEFESYSEFALNLGTNFLLQSNAYLQVVGFVKSTPNSIYVVPNNKVQITSGSNESMYQINTTGLYQFLSGNFKISVKDPRILDKGNLREIYHIHSFNQTTDNLLSVSKLGSIKKEMDIIDQSLVKMISMLKNGFNIAAIASVNTMDQGVFDEFCRQLNSYYSGAGNTDRIIPTMGDSIDIKPFERSNRDMQTLENKTDSKKMIYSRFDIPQPLIDQASQTYNNYQTALYSLYDTPIIPMAKNIFQKMTKMFRDRKMLSEDQYIHFDTSKVPALQLRMAEELRLLKDVGVHTVNEMRSIYGSEDVGKVGDDIYVEASKLPIGQETDAEDNQKRRKEVVRDLKKSGYQDSEIIEYIREYEEISRKK